MVVEEEGGGVNFIEEQLEIRIRKETLNRRINKKLKFDQNDIMILILIYLWPSVHKEYIFSINTVLA